MKLYIELNIQRFKKGKTSNKNKQMKYAAHFAKILTTTSKGKTNKKHRKG